METAYISAEDAATQTGKSRRRINQLVALKKLPGVRIGNSNAVDRRSAEFVRMRRLWARKQKERNSNGSKA